MGAMRLGGVLLLMAVAAVGSSGVRRETAFVPSANSGWGCLLGAETETCSNARLRHFAVPHGRPLNHLNQARTHAGRQRGLLATRAFGGSGGSQLMSTVRQYGLAAVTTHITVWAICMAAGMTAFSSGVDVYKVIDLLPESMKEHMDPSGAETLISFQITLALNEVIGAAPCPPCVACGRRGEQSLFRRTAGNSPVPDCWHDVQGRPGSGSRWLWRPRSQSRCARSRSRGRWRRC